MRCRGRPSSSPSAPVSSPAPEVGRSGPLSPGVVALVATVVLAADQLSKHWAVNALDDGRVIDVIGSLRFALGYNSGFAFGTGEGFGRWIGLLAIGVIIGLVVAALRSRGRWTALGLVLIASGAAGNVADRLFRGDAALSGKVVDFIDLQWWPVFNVADSAITVGAVIVAVASFREEDARGGARP